MLNCLSKKQQLIPVDEVESDVLIDVSNTIRLPDWVDRSQVGINVEQIERICRVAGIKTVTIKTLNDASDAFEASDVIEDADIIQGMVEDMVESAYKIAGTDLEEKKAQQMSLTKSKRPERPLEIMCHESELTVILDMDAIESKVNDKDIDAIMMVINTEVKNCLRTAGVTMGVVGYNLIGAIATALIAVIGKKMGGIPTAILLPFLASAIAGIVYEIKGKSPRFSLTGLTGMEIDRAIVVEYLSRTKNLIGRVDPEVISQ